MKFWYSSAIFIAGLSSLATAQLHRRQNQKTCPSGYSPSVYYVTTTITASPTPTPTPPRSPPATSTWSSTMVTPLSPSAVTCPAGYTPSVYYVTVTTTSSTSTTTVYVTAITSPYTVTSTVTLESVTTSMSSIAAAQQTQQNSGSGSPATPLDSTENSGRATYYGGGIAGGTCSFTDYTLPSGIFGTALSSNNWNNAADCGACVTLTGPNGNSIKAMIVDECPNCGENHLDLFPDAFAALAKPSTGVIGVTWSLTPCNITSPIVLNAKSGSSQYWFSMDVVNANVPVASLGVSTDGGKTWTATERTYYNYFEYSNGFGTETVDVKVTSVTGESILINNVSCASNASTTATSNFSN